MCVAVYYNRVFMKALFGNQRVNLCKWGKKSLKLIFGIKLGLSPMSYIDKKDPKFLVIHGDADPVVPYCQSEFFAKALEERGVFEGFITVAGGEYGPVAFNDNTFLRMVRFFQKEAGISLPM